MFESEEITTTSSIYGIVSCRRATAIHTGDVRKQWLLQYIAFCVYEKLEKTQTTSMYVCFMFYVFTKTSNNTKFYGLKTHCELGPHRKATRTEEDVVISLTHGKKKRLTAGLGSGEAG